MNILKANKENIRKAVDIIRSGGLVAFPTETVYGLGANGLNPIAVSKIFEAKQRPAFNPLILHVSSLEMLRTIAIFDEPKLEELVNKFWPGPLTIVLNKKELVPDIVTAGNETVAVRMPAHPTALELIETSGVPIAAPSANTFSKLSPTTAEHVKNQLGSKVDLILDGGKSSVGVESTIIKLEKGEFFLLRPGGLANEEIQKITGALGIRRNEIKPDSPGQLFFHYSPNIPIKFYSEELAEKYSGKRAGILKLMPDTKEQSNFVYKYLSVNGDLHQAAANLFVLLHEFENDHVDLILAEKIPEEGLGIAIMDRLIKATNRYIDFD